MKKHLDERQNQIVNGIAVKAFYSMFITGVLAVVTQLVFLDMDVKSVMGETVML